MSVQRHPNIQAVALTITVIDAILDNLRGPASEASKAEIVALLEDDLIEFSAAISDKLDKAYGTEVIKELSVQELYDRRQLT